MSTSSQPQAAQPAAAGQQGPNQQGPNQQGPNQQGPEQPQQPQQEGFMASLIAGSRSQSWMASFLFHVCIFLILALVLGTVKVVEQLGSAPTFEAPPEPPPIEEKIENFEVGDTPLDPTELTTDSLTLSEAPREAVDAQFNSNDAVFVEAGGGTPGASDAGGISIDVRAVGTGPIAKGDGGIGAGGGTGKNAGKGGSGTGFGSRGSGMREAMLGNGGTKQSERAVAAALVWLARHQNPDGSWSLNHTGRCQNGRCSGPGDAASDSGATAMGLLPYFAAGQTHESKGPYKAVIGRGIRWLLTHQKANGDLSAGASQMYSHGLATIALCEAYGMTQDSSIGFGAQNALNFIMTGQNQEGGWRYSHGSADSDMSVVGWQVMALKSGQMAGLQVTPLAMDKARNYLNISASGSYKDRFGYTPKSGAALPMTAVGLLLSQYLGAGKDSPVVNGGTEYLSQNLPNQNQRNIYYWYYATQAMHNVPGPTWDTWNRAMRRLLIESQDKNGCAAGSWDPEKPTGDAWGKQGGRMMVTALSCLTLEVYYRYLPLYKLDGKKDNKPAGGAAEPKGAEKKAPEKKAPEKKAPEKKAPEKKAE